MASEDRVEIWTDGGCKPNPGPGGWAAILRFRGVEKELSGGDAATTNNRMELTAAAEALEALKKPSNVVVHTDSEYVANGLTRWATGWVRKNWRGAAGDPVKNMDVAAPVGRRKASPGRVEMDPRAQRRCHERAGRPIGDRGAAAFRLGSGFRCVFPLCPRRRVSLAATVPSSNFTTSPNRLEPALALPAGRGNVIVLAPPDRRGSL